MVLTPHGVMPLSPLVAQSTSTSPIVPRGSAGRLDTIGEVGAEAEAEAEAEEGQREREEEKGKQVARKIRFWDEIGKPDDSEKK